MSRLALFNGRARTAGTSRRRLGSTLVQAVPLPMAWMLAGIALGLGLWTGYLVFERGAVVRERTEAAAELEEQRAAVVAISSRYLERVGLELQEMADDPQWQAEVAIILAGIGEHAEHLDDQTLAAFYVGTMRDFLEATSDGHSRGLPEGDR